MKNKDTVTPKKPRLRLITHRALLLEDITTELNKILFQADNSGHTCLWGFLWNSLAPENSVSVKSGVGEMWRYP